MNRRRNLVVGCVLLLSLSVKAQSCLPQIRNVKETFRTLSCKYDGAKLQESKSITSSSDWAVKMDKTLSNR